MGTNWRLFVAVDPPREIVEAIGTTLVSSRPLAPNARWLNPEKLHLTLAFLGSIPSEKAAAIEGAMIEVAKGRPSFSLACRGAGTFGGKRRPRVLWLDIKGEIDALALLQGAVGEALEPLGYQRESRPFRPHLTLARAKNPKGDPDLLTAAASMEELDLGEFLVDELILYRSELSPAGAKYSKVAVVPLQGPRSER